MSSDLCRGRALGTCGGGRPPASSPLGARGPQVAPRRGLGSSGEGGGRRTQATGAGRSSHALPVTCAGAFAPPPKQGQVLAFSVGGSPGHVPGLPAEAPEGFPLEAPGSPSLGCSLGAGTLGSLCLSRLPRPELKPPRAWAAGGSAVARYGTAVSGRLDCAVSCSPGPRCHLPGLPRVACRSPAPGLGQGSPQGPACPGACEPSPGRPGPHSALPTPADLLTSGTAAVGVIAPLGRAGGAGHRLGSRQGSPGGAAP